MSVIVEAKNITKSFYGIPALDSVDLAIEDSSVHCLIGENGAGKSTLIKILTGIYTPDSGSVRISGKPAAEDRNLFRRIAYVPQELNLFREMTVAENLFMPFERSGIKKRVINRSRLEALAVEHLKLFEISAKPNELVKNISVSDRQLLQIARAMVDEDASVLLLDEPTTSLTDREIDKLFHIIRQLKARGKAVVFISHKLEEVFSIGDEITVLRNGVRVAHTLTSEADIPWVISKMAGRSIDQDETFIPQWADGDVLMEVEGLSGEKFRDVSFKLHAGEILGFSGLVGSGRTELMQAILGRLPVWTGSVRIEGRKMPAGNQTATVRNGFLYLPEERKQQGILPDLSVMSNISCALIEQLCDGLLVSAKKERAKSEEVVRTYSIKIASLKQSIKYLSGGNQQKAIIGRSIAAKPKILVFDEPTKGIDVGTKVEIYKLMKKFAEEQRLGIILISSEMNEVLKCSNRVIAMYLGKKAREFTAPVDKTMLLHAIMGIAVN